MESVKATTCLQLEKLGAQFKILSKWSVKSIQLSKTSLDARTTVRNECIFDIKMFLREFF